MRLNNHSLEITSLKKKSYPYGFGVLSFFFGIATGLLIAAYLAFYITKTPVPFANKLDGYNKTKSITRGAVRGAVVGMESASQFTKKYGTGLMKYYSKRQMNPMLAFSGIGTLIGNIKDKNISNIRIFPDDIRILLDEKVQDKIFDAVKIICPDPWPKERHHKRRLINKDFLKSIHNSMKDQANLYISTDWENYAQSIKDVLKDSQYFELSKRTFLKKEYLTKFEQRGKDEGREIFEFNYQKKNQ